jgi:hypothetical protein
MTPDEQIALVRIETKLDNLDEKVDLLQNKVFGNGKPGLLVDQIVQSEQIGQLLTYAKSNADNISKLKEVATPTWISKNWIRIITLTILIILLVHSFIPEGLTLWQILSMIK